jgi:hypothetical protein
MHKKFDKLVSAGQPQTQTWYEAVLIPNGVSLDKIKILSDVIKEGGKIIDPAYYK